MQNYLQLLKKIVDEGHAHRDRTGVGRTSLYGEVLRFDMREGLPLITTRKVPYRGIILELLWFISGSTTAKDLHNQGIKIWDSWTVQEQHIEAFLNKHSGIIANEREELRQALMQKFDGSIGNMYGHAWRNAPAEETSVFHPLINENNIASDKLALYRQQFDFIREHNSDVLEEQWSEYLMSACYSHVDQLQSLVVNLRERPYSSRHVVSAWIPGYMPFEDLSPQENVILGKGALAACHTMFQCFVIPPTSEDEKPKLSMMLTQRSADFPVGSCFNIAQYSILLCMLAQISGYEAYELIYSLGDVHYYADQLEGIKEQLTRTPLQKPQLRLNPQVTDLYKFTSDDICISDYESHPAISYPVAI